MADKPAEEIAVNEIKEPQVETKIGEQAEQAKVTEPEKPEEPVKPDKPEKQPEQQKPQRRKHRKKHYLLRLVIVLVLIAAAVVCAHLKYFDTDGIAVIGNQEVTDEEIIKLSGVKLGDSVFDVHPFLVQHKIKKNLYIESVNVNRKLPNEIEIIVTERSLLAQFKMDDKFVVTDDEGMVLDISKEEKKATVIEGITVTGAEKKDTIEIKENKGLERALEFISVTDGNDLYFKRVIFNGKKVEAYVYDDLKCAGKYDNFIATIKSGTLGKVIYDLYQKDKDEGTVNIYNNDYCFFTPK